MLRRRPDIVRALQVAYGRCCLNCRAREHVVWDHVIPMGPKHGGDNALANLQPLCMSCNLRKRGLAMDYRSDHGAAGAELDDRYQVQLRQFDDPPKQPRKPSQD